MEPSSLLTLPVGFSPAERRRRSEEAGRALVAGWESSGMTMRAYAKLQGIRVQRVSYWRIRLCRRAKPKVESSASFVEIIRPTRTVSGGGVTIELAHGVRLRVEPGFDAGLLRSVLSAVSGGKDSVPC